MSKGQVTPFKGSKFFIQTDVSAGTSITSVTATKPGTLETAEVVAKGDILVITGLPGFDGEYVVSSVSLGTVTLANADWTGLEVPSDYTGALAAAAKFSANWCEVTGISKTGGTIDQTEVSTICSVRKEYEPGLADAGTLQVNFNFAPATDIQQQLLAYEVSAEKFWAKLVLPRSQGTMLYYGSIQTGMNMDGAVNGNYTSGVTIQLSGDYFHVKAV